MNTNNTEITEFEAIKMANDIMKALTAISLPLPNVFPFSLISEMAVGVVLLAAMHLRKSEVKAAVYPKLMGYGPGIVQLWELVMTRALELSASSNFTMWDKEPSELSQAEEALRAFRANKS